MLVKNFPFVVFLRLIAVVFVVVLADLDLVLYITTRCCFDGMLGEPLPNSADACLV